eukprot:TRINITY_DN2286_c0_g1_i1.p1 TRINITY_DN2286_c0_g1~~TRINITY_DN2286_c0_g1_i1.p1  ORF type:complete len:584 (-),score=74.14 TRINITY_DN2286_c0_g1_i1:544-2295(-)
MGRDGESPTCSGTIAVGASGSGNMGDLSDCEDDWETDPPELCGNLSKWTNYIHGWQPRFMALKDGTLVYYRSANETDFGCRGAISIRKADVRLHDYDELRFDVTVTDCTWYLKSSSKDEREKWVLALQSYRRIEQEKLKRHGSSVSLLSNSHSISSTKVKASELTEKLAECETFKEILGKQIDTLQCYFDASAEMTNALGGNNGQRCKMPVISGDVVKKYGLQSTDFKAEAITFKATTTGILASISHCIELMQQREEQLRRKLEKETSARKSAEEACRNAEASLAAASLSSPVIKGGPDFEEGPHSQIGEDEFYDAVESELDRLEIELEKKEQHLKTVVENSQGPGYMQHRLGSLIEDTTANQLKYARITVGPEEGVWELFAEDGEMKMYKREEEVDGMVVDPLKAIHQVKGVSAKELCHYFFSPDVRLEWEHTIDDMSVLEKIDEDTLIFLQVHKRIWPAAQRDALFWSHIRKVDTHEADVIDSWIVCNKSCDHPDAPLGQGGCLRVDLTVCFLCQTVVPPGLDRNDRNNLTCRITYCSVVNPGGWAPASVLRTVYKREYPRFLKRFTQYVIEKTRGLAVLW